MGTDLGSRQELLPLLLSLGPHLMRPHLCSALHGSFLSPQRGCPSSLWPRCGRALELQPPLSKGSGSSPALLGEAPISPLGSGVLPWTSWPWESGVSGGAGGQAHLALRVCGGVDEYQGRGRSIKPPQIPPNPWPLCPDCSLLAWWAVRFLECSLLADSEWGPRPKLVLPRPHQLPPGSQHSVRADGSLHLDQALLEDAGRYTCLVSNSAGSQHRDVELVVQGESWGGGGHDAMGEGPRGELDLEHLCLDKLHK